MYPSNIHKKLLFPSFNRGWIAIISAALFFCYQFILRVAPNVINEELTKTFAIDATALGVVLGFYSWAYAGLQLPLGIVMDRYGPKLFIMLGAFVRGTACFMFGYASSSTMASIARFMMGMGSSCGFIGCLKLGTLWFASKDMGKVIGVTYFFGTLGATLGGMPLRHLFDSIGFNKMMTILGIIGITLSFFIFLCVRNHPPQKLEEIQEGDEHYSSNHPFEDFIHVIRNPQSWIVFFYGMLMYVPIAIIGEAWGIPFLEKVYQIDESAAAPLVSAMFIGAALGSPLFTVLSDRFKSRRIFMILGAILNFIIYVLIVYNESITLKIMFVLLFLAGFAYAAKGIGFVTICDIMPREMSGVSIAFVNIGVMSAGTIFHPLMGYLVNLHWDGQMFMDSPLYSEGNYRFALSLIPIGMIISIILAALVRESHPDSAVNALPRRKIRSEVI